MDRRLSDFSAELMGKLQRAALLEGRFAPEDEEKVRTLVGMTVMFLGGLLMGFAIGYSTTRALAHSPEAPTTSIEAGSTSR